MASGLWGPFLDYTGLGEVLDHLKKKVFLEKGETAKSSEKLETARKITLAGDAKGTTSFDGTEDVTINVTVEELAEKVPIARKINGKALSSDIALTASDVGADSVGSAAAALTSANKYTDTSISGLINGAPTTLDTLKEIADAMAENESVVEALESAIGSKAESGHTHSAATTSAPGFMSAADKVKLDGIATGANKTTVDSALSSTSTNPVQNKVVNTALAGKAAASHSHAAGDITSGTLPLARGGTGATTAAAARANLAVPMLDTTTNTSYPALLLPGGGAMSYLRSPASGFIPNTTSSNSVVGTSSWPFANGRFTALSIGTLSLTNALSVANGGTGATTAAAARSALGITLANLGAAAASHNHAASNITSGTLPVARGGTGQTTVANIRKSLFGTSGITNYIATFNGSWADGGYLTPQQLRNTMGLGNTTGAVPIANGGTAGTTAATARTNLGVAAKPISATNKSVATSSFVTYSASSDETQIYNAGYVRRAAIAVTGVTAAMFANVVINEVDVAKGIFASSCVTYAGGVYIYAKSVPSAAVTVKSIVAFPLS